MIIYAGAFLLCTYNHILFPEKPFGNGPIIYFILICIIILVYNIIVKYKWVLFNQNWILVLFLEIWVNLYIIHFPANYVPNTFGLETQS